MAIDTTTSVDVQTLTPFKRFIMTIGLLPTSYLESMTYAELVMWFCNFLQEQVIPTVNNNAEAVQELQNWFNNLDVQDEIDHKLDEMVEAGTLQEIIAEYLNSKALFGFDTVADLKEATNLLDGSYAKTLGYHVKNDGGSSTYKIRTITNNDVVDNMTIIELSDDTLIAELILPEQINPQILGAYADGTHNDYETIQKAVDLGNVLLGNGSYYIEHTIEIPNNRIFDGNGQTIIPNNNVTAFTLEGNGVNNARVNTTLKNIIINTTNHAGACGISLKDGYFNYFDNININRLTGNDTFGFKIVNGFNHVISNSRVLGNLTYSGQIGLDISSTNNGDGIENMTNCKYDTLLLQNTRYGVKTNYVTTANVVEFNNLGFSSCQYAYYLDGHCNPVIIKNSRIEIGTYTAEAYGIYLNNDIHAKIDSLNVYNIHHPIYNNSTQDLDLTGELCFTGTSKSPKYVCIYSNGNVMINTRPYVLSTTYDFISNANLASGKFISNGSGFNNYGGTINSDNYTITAPGNVIVKATNRIFNVYGARGCEILVYTELDNIKIQTSTNGSTTSMLTGSNIDMIPNKFYKIKMIDANKWTLID